MDNIKIKIDGQEISVPKDFTVLDAINHNDTDKIIDAVGDIYVTLRGVCQVIDVPFDKCIEAAYNEIKDRKGYLSAGGVFVKEE